MRILLCTCVRIIVALSLIAIYAYFASLKFVLCLIINVHMILFLSKKDRCARRKDKTKIRITLTRRMYVRHYNEIFSDNCLFIIDFAFVASRIRTGVTNLGKITSRVVSEPFNLHFV